MPQNMLAQVIRLGRRKTLRMAIPYKGAFSGRVAMRVSLPRIIMPGRT